MPALSCLKVVCRRVYTFAAGLNSNLEAHMSECRPLQKLRRGYQYKCDVVPMNSRHKCCKYSFKRARAEDSKLKSVYTINARKKNLDAILITR